VERCARPYQLVGEGTPNAFIGTPDGAAVRFVRDVFATVVIVPCGQSVGPASCRSGRWPMPCASWMRSLRSMLSALETDLIADGLEETAVRDAVTRQRVEFLRRYQPAVLARITLLITSRESVIALVSSRGEPRSIPLLAYVLASRKNAKSCW